MWCTTSDRTDVPGRRRIEPGPQRDLATEVELVGGQIVEDQIEACPRRRDSRGPPAPARPLRPAGPADTGLRRRRGRRSAALRGGRRRRPAPPEGLGVEPIGELDGGRQVVGRARPFQPEQEPEAGLGRRQRVPAVGRRGPAAAARGPLFPPGQPGGQRGHRRGVEHVPQRERAPSAARTRVTNRAASSELPPRAKKSSSAPTRSRPSTSAEQPGQHLFGRPGRPPPRAAGRQGRRRQGVPVELLVGVERQGAGRTTTAAGTM